MALTHPVLEERARERRFLRPFLGEALTPPPVWLMRQAGRYLPEYRATRTDAGSFLDLCYNPALAAEVTLQPIRRYAFDAAILFSDILVIPHAIGQGVRFVEGEGPRLDPVTTAKDLAALSLDKLHANLAPVYETVARLRQDLPKETALIGFCGAPWTVATYAVAGRGTQDQAPARLWAYQDPDAFQVLIDLLVEASTAYLSQQVQAGAEVLQIFDTWAGSLPDDEFERWVVAPTAKIVSTLKARHPEVPVIGFAKGAGVALARYAQATGVDGVGCDTSLPLAAARAALPSSDGPVIQGNLDPLLLVAGGDHLNRRIDELLEAMEGRPYIFNLGHGIVPQTPPEHVAQLVERVRKGAQ